MTRSDASFPTSEKKLGVHVIEGFYEFYFRNPRNEYLSYLVVLVISTIYACVNALLFKRPEGLVVVETSGLIAVLLFVIPLFYSISLVQPKVYVDATPNERQAVWRGVEPIVTHSIVVVLLEVSLFVIRLLMLDQLKSLPANYDSYIWILPKITLWLGLTLGAAFGVYALVLVSIRLAKSIVDEIRGESRASTTSTEGDKLARSTLPG